MLEKVQKSATKLILDSKNMAYIELLISCKIPTLHYRQIRGVMIEILKKSGKYDAAVIPQVNRELSYDTRGNDLRLEKSRSKYDLRKCNFTNRVVNIWNSLPNVVLCDTVNKFKSHLDKIRQYQDIVYNYKAEIHGTGSQSFHR